MDLTGERGQAPPKTGGASPLSPRHAALAILLGRAVGRPSAIGYRTILYRFRCSIRSTIQGWVQGDRIA